MTKLLERPEVREVPHNMVVERTLTDTPPKRELRPPPRRRGVRWIRWMIAAVVLVLAAAGLVVITDSGQDAGVVGTSHPLAELNVTESVFVPVAGIAGVYEPSTLTGTTNPLGDVALAIRTAPVASDYVPSIFSGSTNPYVDVALGSGYALGDYYVPSVVTGTTNPVLGELARAAVPLSEAYVPSTVSGSTHPYAPMGEFGAPAPADTNPLDAQPVTRKGPTRPFGMLTFDLPVG